MDSKPFQNVPLNSIIYPNELAFITLSLHLFHVINWFECKKIETLVFLNSNFDAAINDGV